MIPAIDLGILWDVVNYKGLGSSAKILWLTLYIRYGNEPFSGGYEEMAREVGSKRYTVRAQVWQLKEVGAIKVQPFYEKEKSGNSGQTFTIMKPKEWKYA